MGARKDGSFVGGAGVQAARSAVKAALWTGAGALARRVSKPESAEFHSDTPPPPRGARTKAWAEAFAKDIADVRAGLYPPSDPMFRNAGEAAAAIGDFLKDAREVEARRRRGGGVEAREEPGAEAYPVYFRQNFHFQSGGWFTRDSARRYEPQVEALFAGTAGAMRRRGLSLLAKALRDRDQRRLTIVDLACGAGAFLREMTTAFPRARLIGLDLSPAYAPEAAAATGAPVVQANVERTPFADASLDAASCVYLFHELPPKLRPAIAAEIARILKPGGLFVLVDSVQPADQPELARLLEAFPAIFHEPYYDSWRVLDVPALFAAQGLRLVDTDAAFLTKAWLFERPL
jgi:ubiquinone/menaquinone biosynthesis C-methylase UbiE